MTWMRTHVHMFIKPAVNTKLRGVTNTMDNEIPIQKGLDRLILMLNLTRRNLTRVKLSIVVVFFNFNFQLFIARILTFVY